GAINSLQACVETPLLVPYTQLGSVPASASYVVQFSEDLTAWQTAPTSGLASPLTVILPASLANKLVYYRVSYLLNGVLVAGTRYDGRLQIKSAPNVLLTTPTGATAIQIDRANSYAAEIRLIDLSSDASVIVAGGSTILRAGASANGYAYYINQPGTYSVVSAVNSCGYGRASGLIRVTEKPYLALLKASRTSACVGQTVSFSYTAAGGYETGNKFAVYLVDNSSSSQAKTLLTETTALGGVVSFSLSADLKASSYRIQLEASAPKTVFNTIELLVDAPVSVTLLPGAGAFYQNDTKFLRVFASGSNAYSLTLASPVGETIIKPNYIIYDFPVQLTQSGSYSIVGVANQCGVGRSTGLYSVSVIPAASVTIRPTAFGSLYCTGKDYQVSLNTTGVFSTTNTFTAYLADSTGANVRTLPTVSGTSQLTITIPTGIPDDDRYVLRIGSSSPQHLGASLPQYFSIRQLPTGTLTGNASLVKGDSARISIALTGTPPWRFVLTDFFGPRTFNTSTTPYTLTVKPDTTIGFRLTEVRDSQCGVGTATGTALVTVTKVLATEPALPLRVRTWPNPTAGWLQIEGDLPGRGDVLVRLHTASGTLVQTSVGPVRQGQLRHRIDLSSQPAGVYILTAEQEGRRNQFKVLKQ
ncbi:MAG TPA: T9SS type A sorting domain-containing protein, partial [Fibrella sp.]